MGFDFDRLGCRVPTIAISAYTGAGTIIHDLMDHGSMLATLERVHGLDPLTRATTPPSNPIFGVVNLGTPRDPSTWPTTTPQYNPPNPETAPPHPANVNKDKPLTPPAAGHPRPADREVRPRPQAAGDLRRGLRSTLHELGDGIFGTGPDSWTTGLAPFTEHPREW